MVKENVIVQEIRECRRCGFWDSEIRPLGPSMVASPAAVMFVGENPSWAEGLYLNEVGIRFSVRVGLGSRFRGNDKDLGVKGGLGKSGIGRARTGTILI